MTVSEYLMEHHPWEGDEPDEPRICEYCGGEIVGAAISDGEVMLHEDCGIPYILEQLTNREICERCGFYAS